MKKTRSEMIEDLLDDLPKWLERMSEDFWEHVRQLEQDFLSNQSDEQLEQMCQIISDQEEDDKFIVDVKYPHIHVQLTGKDGNAFVILGLMEQALKKEKVPQGEIQEFLKEAQSSDYDHLLQTCMKWITVT